MAPRENRAEIVSAEVVLPCAGLDETAAFFTGRLGFRLDAVFPADDPRVAVISGHGLRLRLDRAATAAPGHLRLRCGDPRALAGGQDHLIAPNGTRIDLVPAVTAPAFRPLEPAFAIYRDAGLESWVTGRAGMRYRDLIPGRLGGRVIASQIAIPEGGPVPDSVHYHEITFQMIFCAKGWVRVVYGDQGPPFVLQAGDCVLQPPRIRHRVLEASPELEVIEIGSPAEHLTCLDHALALPNPALRPERAFEGQRFLHHQAQSAVWGPGPGAGFEARDLGIAEATGGLAAVQVVRALAPGVAADLQHQSAPRLAVLLAGDLQLQDHDGAVHHLSGGDAFLLPAGTPCSLTAGSDDLEWLAVRLPL